MYSDSEEDENETALQIEKLYTIKVPPTHGLLHKQQQQQQQSASLAKKGGASVITTAAYDKTTRRLYYGLESGELCFWTLATDGAGTSRHAGSHKGPVTHICIPDKKTSELGAAGLIITGSTDSHIKIWDYKGKVMQDPTVCVQTLYGHGGTITGICVYGSYIISSSTDKTIKVWKAVEGRGQLVYPWYDLQSTVATMGGWVRSLSFDHDTDVGDVTGAFYASDEDGNILKIVPQCVYDEHGKRSSKAFTFAPEGYDFMSTGSSRIPVAIFSPHDRGVLLVRYVGQWQMLLTASYDNCLRVYETATCELKFQWENESRCHYTAVEVDLEFSEVLAADNRGNLHIYSIKTGRLMATKQIADGPVVSILAVLGRQLYVVCTAREVTVWKLEHELDYNVLRGGHEKAVISLYTCSGGVGVDSGDQDYRIFSAGLDNTVRLWDPYDMACIRVIEESRSEISAMVFFEAWGILVTGHDDGDIRLWDLDTSSHQTLKGHSNSVTSLALALIRRNEELLISGSYDGMVVLWDIRSLRGEPPHMVAKFRAHGVDRPLSAHQPNQLAAVLAASAQAAKLEQPSSDLAQPSSAAAAAEATAASSLSVASAAAPEVLSIRFDPVKNVIVTAGGDKSIKVWAAQGYMYLGKHVGHTDAVTCLAMDANLLFSGSEDCTIRLWDAVPAAPDGSQFNEVLGFTTSGIKVLEGHTRCVTALEVMPSAGHLVSCSLDGSLRFWDYITGTVMHRYNHHEELRCLALRFDRQEVLVGTMQASILRYAADEEAIAKGAAEGPINADACTPTPAALAGNPHSQKVVPSFRDAKDGVAAAIARILAPSASVTKSSR